MLGLLRRRNVINQFVLDEETRRCAAQRTSNGRAAKAQGRCGSHRVFRSRCFCYCADCLAPVGAGCSISSLSVPTRVGELEEGPNQPAFGLSRSAHMFLYPVYICALMGYLRVHIWCTRVHLQ